jgi:photosynthesis system II assembly factor YCF48-like protein
MKDDQSFERLLRSARPGQPSASGIGPCLDGETLAAWVDGGLTSKQLAQAELHVSSCARCQAAVAATMTSAPLIPSSETGRTPAFSLRLPWLVPVAAGVAAVGLWFMVPSQSQFVAPTPESSQVAVDRVAQAPVEQPGAPPTARDQQAPESSLGKLADARARQSEERNEAAPPAPKAEAFNEQRADELTAARERQEAEAKKDAAKSAADNFAPPSPQEPPARVLAPAASAPAALAPDAAPVSAPTTPATVSGAAAPPPRAAALSSNALNRSAKLQVPFEVVSPNQAIRWRVSMGGAIERSTDAGSTWTPQSSGVMADLLAGSSPSPDVCWLVGGSGAVLRTSDGGRQWRRVTFVGSFDLQAVTATDASTAEVTTSDGRRFRTEDAGITWR